MPSYAALLATVYCVLPDMDIFFYHVRRFVPGLVRSDVARAAWRLAVGVAGVAAVFHHVMPWFLDSAHDVVAHHFKPFPILARISS